MKKLLVLLFNFYFAVLSVFGQGNALYREIQQAKDANTYFENVVLTRSSAEEEALRGFINPDEVSFFENSSFNSINNETKAINLYIPFKREAIILELIEAPEYFYEYEIITSEWEKFPANRDIKHYRGVVRNDEHSLAAITFYEDEIMGIVATSEGNFNIAKSKQSGKHLFYNEKNLKAKPDWVCDTEDDPSVTYDSEDLLDEQSDFNNSKATKIVRFFVETEYDIYHDIGSVHEVEVYISGLFNQIAVLYQNEQIQTCVSYLFIWTTNVSYPYAGKNTSADLLDQFRKTRKSITGDLGMLLTFRDIGGGRAHVDGLCSILTKNKLGVAGNLSSNLEIFNNYNWSITMVAHELGHLLGSKHTHACVWNGNNTAIDGCEDVEGSCPKPPKPPGGGTIMSYCDLNGGPGINFSLGFGTQPGNVIRNKVSKANCLNGCTTTTINNKTYKSGKSYTEIGCKIEISNTTFKTNTDVKVHGQEKISLQSGTKAEYGSYVKFTTGAQVHVQSKSAYTAGNDSYDETTLESLEELSETDSAFYDTKMLVSLEESITESQITDIDFTLYPNPNDGIFTVKITGKIEPYTVEIFNALGRVIGNVNCHEETIHINQTDLPAGIYYVRMTINDKTVVKKAVIQ